VPEALTGAHAGRVLSREIEFNSQGPRVFLGSKATPAAPLWRGVAGSGAVDVETLSMRGSIVRENREALHTTHGGWRRGSRWEVQGLEPPMNGAGSLTAG
jgi:hypothetical protein